MSEGRPCLTLPPELLANARVLSQRADILPHLPPGGTYVEVGVALGGYSEIIQKTCRPDTFIGIDIFTMHHAKMVWGKPSVEVFQGKTHEAFYRERFKTAISDGRMRVMAGDSAQRLAELGDGTIDVAYVDADHTYDFVSEELALLGRKVSDDGWIVLNDYTMGNVKGSGFLRFGVIQATHEFMIAQRWEMMFLALHPEMYCDVALRRLPR